MTSPFGLNKFLIMIIMLFFLIAFAFFFAWRSLKTPDIGSAVQPQLQMRAWADIVAVSEKGELVTNDNAHLVAAGLWLPRNKDGHIDQNWKSELEETFIGKRVWLSYPGLTRDARGRPVAIISLLEEADFTESLQGNWLSQGRALTRLWPDQAEMANAFYPAEDIARLGRFGGWQQGEGSGEADKFPFFAADDPARIQCNQFVIIQGSLRKVAEKRGGGFYLNFGEDYREDFTLVVEKRAFPKNQGLEYFQSLIGSTLQMRGWCYLYNGPTIRLEHAHNLRILETVQKQ